QNRDRRREMDDDAEIELAAGSDDPQSGFHFRVARSVGVQPIEKAFNVVLGHHLASLLSLVKTTNSGKRRFTSSEAPRVILSEAKDRFRAKALELPRMDSDPSSLRSSG